MNKVIKNIKLDWNWFGDIYLLRGFNIAIMNENSNPSTNDLSGALAYTTIQSPKQIIEKQKSDDQFKFTYTFYNQMFDENTTIVPWIQALHENSDSDWVSLDGAIIEDDGNATIVVIGNPTFQQVVDMATDSKITPQEKLFLEKEWDEIVTDHYMTLLGAVKANLPSNHPDLVDYDNKIDILAAYLNYNKDYTFHPTNHQDYTYPSMITDGLTTDLNTLHYEGYEKYKKVFNDFYEAKVKLLEAIRQAILDNNNEMIQNEIDKNTLPDTITIGGYTTGNFDINKNYDSLLQLGTIKIGTGHFITTTGQKFKIENSEEIVTNLASNSSRTKYILFVGADKSRFNMLDEKASKNYISALPKNGEWWYFNGANDDYRPFTPIPEDCVVAKIEEHNSSSNDLGIRAIKFMCSSQESVFNQLTDNGEQQFIGKDENGRLFINGEYIQAHTIKGSQILTNGLKAISTEDGRTTIEITETGEAYLDLKNFTLRAGGTIKMQGVVTFESLDNDMQENFTQVEGKTTINGDNIKTGVITANNNVSEFNLNSGTFRLGGTGPNDYKLYFDGENLNFADGAIQWPEIPNIEIPGLDDLVNHSVSLSKDTIAIKVDSKGTPEENEIGINGKAVSAITVHRSNVMLTGVDESVSVLGKDEFKYIITRTVNCVAGRKSNNEIYIESIENNRAVLGIEEDYGIIDEYGFLDSNIIEGGYIELDVICGDKNQTFKKAISFSLIKEGQDGSGYTVILSNEAHTVACDENGEPLEGELGITGLAVTDITAYKNTNKLKPIIITDGNYSSMAEGEYSINIVEQNGCKADIVDADTIYIKEISSISAYVSVNVICEGEPIAIKRMSLTKTIKGQPGQDGTDGIGSYVAVLTNDFHSIPTDPNGNNGNYTGCETSLVIHYGEEVINATCTAQASQGVIGSLRDNTYTVTNMTTDSGYVDITAIINEKEYTKRFTITKNKSGEGGVVFKLVSSHSIIHKSNNGEIIPSTIVFGGKKQKGEGSLENFACKFKISVSTDGSTFINKYESATPESTYTYTIPKDVLTVRCQMIKADTNSILDEERIPVVSDGKKGEQGEPGPPGPEASLPGWVEDWTSNSTMINGQSMISPRIFAGVGGSYATGVALGRQALGASDTASNIGMGIYGAGNLIGKIKSIPDNNGIVVEFGVGATKMTIDKNGNVSAPKMTANEIVSSINGGSTTIHGGKITTNSITANQIKTGTITAAEIAAYTITAVELSSDCIEARHITADSISVNKLSSNNENPIIKLFQTYDGSYCSIDATRANELGQGDSLRLKWNRDNYIQIGCPSNSEPYFNIYMGDGHADSSKTRMALRYESFQVLRPIGSTDFTYDFYSTYCNLKVDNIFIGRGNCRIDTSGGVLRLFTSAKGSTDRGIRIQSNAGRLDINSSTINFTTSSGSSKTVSFSDHSHSEYASSSHSHNKIGTSSNYVQVYGGNEVELKSGSATVYLTNYSAYSFWPDHSGIDLGGSGSRWRTIYAQNSLNTSDKQFKKNIRYIDDTKLFNTKEESSTPFLDFIKNNLKIATYTYKTVDNDGYSPLANDQIGFIANDIINTNIGQTFLYDYGKDGIMYSPTGYTTIVARGLQEETKLREELLQKVLKIEENIEKLREDILININKKIGEILNDKQ